MMAHETYMHRCFQLALLGAGHVAPNPMVGAVLVYNDSIIGEGYHQQYGQAHAEVNCINSVQPEDQHLVEKSTMYVSLEPCAHFGKTPPCADLIIKRKIPSVVIGCSDSFKEVAGKGIQKLLDAGVNVTTPILEQEAIELNQRFFTFHNKHRPYIILKWAQTANRQIGNADNSRLLITNELTNRKVHQWRSQEASILVGTNTALKDDPSLTNRLWTGSNPLRLVIDTELKLPPHLHLFDGTQKTIIFNFIEQADKGALLYQKISAGEALVPQLLSAVYKREVQSVLVEGGAKMLQSFIEADCWDEARIITNTELISAPGIAAPVLTNAALASEERVGADTIQYFKHP